MNSLYKHFYIVAISFAAVACGDDDEDAGPQTLTTQQYCERLVAQCPEAGTADQCAQLVELVPAECSAQSEAVRTCAGPNPTFQCAGAFSTPQGCEDQQADVVACVLTNAPDAGS